MEGTPKEQARQYPQVTLEKDAPAADLTVVLIEGFDQQNPSRTFIQVDSKFFKSTVTFTKPRGQQGWIDDGYEKFSLMSTQRAQSAKPSRDKATLAAVSPPADLAVSQARGFGRELYLKFAPTLFKEAFWKVRKELGDSFRSIQIYTNDPNFPWELLRPVPSDGSGDLDFLGIEYAVGRWPLHNTSDLQRLPLRSASVSELDVIAPSYTGTMELTHQKEELRALESIPGFNLVPGQIGAVKRLFGRFPQGIIHFTGHGVVVELPGKSQQFSMVLEDGEISLIEWQGMVSRKSNTHPLIFFNACDLGRTRRVANSVDGWAPAAVEAGASGYIGALWPLNDEGAARFGVEFYRTLMSQLEDGPIFVADVLRLTRRKFFENNDPTFLGYVFYGDPNLRLVRGARK
jgi:CHAT domain-containing protein